MEEKVCGSCKKRTANDQGAVVFSCPKCAGNEMVRCANCRKNAIKYNCAGCGFEGPN